ncbi:MAG: hypothetical protein ACTHK8_13205 [Ginsengibacter sp.]
MEVHHHPHVEGKKFKHYLFEFFMLFLAVFCGFLAENLREHQLEKEKEHQYIESLVADLKDDVSTIDRQVKGDQSSVGLCDSLCIFLDTPEMARKHGDDIYYAARLGNRRPPLVNNKRTFDQLTNSGGFRLIRKSETSNRIMAYYSQFPPLQMLQDIFNDENNAYKNAEAKVIDPAIFRRQERADGWINKSTDNPKLLTYDPTLLKQMEFKVVQLNGSRRSMVPMMEKIKQSSIDLINYLQKTYHLQ